MSGWGKFVLVVNAFMSLVSMMYCFIKVSLVLVVGVVFNISPQGVMLARGEVATWVTVSDPWISGLHQAAQLCALGPQAWDIILEDVLPSGSSALAAAHWISSLVAGYTALGMLDMVIIYIDINMTNLQRFRRARTGWYRDGVMNNCV